MAENLLTKGELARQFKVHPDTIKNWTKQGLIKPALTINNRDRFSLKEVKKSLSENKK